MKKIQTQKGAAALPIIIGIIVLVIIGGLIISGNSDSSSNLEEDKKVDETMMEDGSHDGDEMMEGEDDVKSAEGGDEMETSPVGNQTGSYEEYSAEKIALAENGDVVIFFHAGWCPTCRNQDKNILNSLEDIPEGVTILKADYDKETDLKQKYGVRLQHSFVQVDAEGNAIAKWAGGSTLKDIIKNIK